MTPFIVKRPSLAVCPKSERTERTERLNEPNVRNPNDIEPNKSLFGFQRCPNTERSDFGR